MGVGRPVGTLNQGEDHPTFKRVKHSLCCHQMPDTSERERLAGGMLPRSSTGFSTGSASMHLGAPADRSDTHVVSECDSALLTTSSQSRGCLGMSPGLTIVNRCTTIRIIPEQGIKVFPCDGAREGSTPQISHKVATFSNRSSLGFCTHRCAHAHSQTLNFDRCRTYR